MLLITKARSGINTKAENIDDTNDTRACNGNCIMQDLIKILILNQLLHDKPQFPPRPPRPPRPPYGNWPRPPYRSDYEGNGYFEENNMEQYPFYN